MKLKDAVELYKKEKDSPVNSYEWYRKSAKEQGKVQIGDTEVFTYKNKGIWHINDEEFDKAIKKYHKTLEQIKKNTEDHKKGIIHGKDGEVIVTEWGEYKIHKNFRFESSTYLIARNKSDGTWYCNECNLKAEEEHKNEECHICEDWGNCGDDCTLSRVFCPKCGKSINF